MADDKKQTTSKNPILDFSDGAKRTKWLLRGVSLLLAVILWFLVGWDGAAHVTKDLSLPLRYQDVPDGYSVSERVSSVTVRIGGSLESLALLGRNDVGASVSLKDLRPGRYRLPIQITNPQSVRVLRVTPQSIEFDLYRTIERTLRPSLEIDGDISDGLKFEEPVYEPPEVVVKGPEAVVVSIKRAVVRASAQDLAGKKRLELPVKLLGDEGEIDGLAIEPSSVRVSVKLSEVLEELRVPVIIQVGGVPGAGLDVGRVIVSPDVVTLRGTRNALANIKELTLDAIDVTGHTENINMVIPLESPAQGITIAGTDSVKIMVELHSSNETKTFMGVPITLGSGSPESRRWKITPPAASVILERSIIGSEPFDVERPPIELYVDVTNVVSDQLALPVLHRGLPDGMRVVRIEPPQVYATAFD